MHIIQDDVIYYPLSMVADNIGEYHHAVYITGSQVLFYHEGRPRNRVLWEADSGLKYVVFNGLLYYVDDSCTLR